METASHRIATRGFSLVELLVVIVIVSVLASIGLPLAELAHRRQQEAELQTALRTLRDALDAYKRSVDEGHITRDAGASGYPPSLQALVDGVEDAKSPVRAKLYFLRRIPRDPLAPPDIEFAADTWGLRSYDSPPNAPREGKDVYDVYSRADGAGLNGVPYRQW